MSQLGRGLFAAYGQDDTDVLLNTAALLVYNLAPGSQVVAVDGDEIGDDAEIFLPGVGESRGSLVIIRMDTIQAAKTATVKDNAQQTSVDWTDQVLAVAGEAVVLLSDGTTWHLLLETIA